MSGGILSGPVALGGSAFGPKPPADRMEALLDVVSAKTPAGKLAALEAGHRAGHISATELIEWASADGSVADEAMRQVQAGVAEPAKAMRKPTGLQPGQEVCKSDPAAVARAQEAEKRRAHNALAGAHARLAGMSAPDWHHADVVATWRDLIGDLSEALERWHALHTPCGCSEANREAEAAGSSARTECSRCPIGQQRCLSRLGES